MNNKGFATISFILLSPALLTLTFGFLWTLWFINQKHKISNLCQYHLLSAQEKLIEGNSRVLALNTRAYSLYARKKALDAFILTAPPPAKVAALRQRAQVVAKQRLLKLQQDGLFMAFRIAAEADAFHLRQDFSNRTNRMHQFWSPSNYSGGTIRISSPRSKLTKRIYDTAPIYKRSSHHKQRQTLTAHWRIPMRDLVPTWLKNKIEIRSHWIGTCQTHPHQRRSQWLAEIGAGSPSSSASSYAFL